MVSFSRSVSFIVFALLPLLLFTGCNQPEPEEPDPIRRKSPIAIANISHLPTNTYIKITYGQPHKRDRNIFGNVVPYDEVWRTGANEATELTTTQDIIFAGERLESGTYALFSIPSEDDQWTIILNDVLGQWGAFDYNPDNDVMRVKVSSMQQDKTTEMFTISFSETTGDSTNIVMQWDQEIVKIPIAFIDE